MHARIPFDSCPLCDRDDATEVAIADCSRHPMYKPSLPATMRWLRCDACGHMFVDGYFDDAALGDLFSDAQPMQTPGHEMGRARVVWAKVVEDVARLRAGIDGRWLDVGFGSGALLTTAAEFGFEVTGLDLRARNVEDMIRFGYQAHRTKLEDFRPEQPFDVVSMADVLEHMPFPRGALARAHEILSDDGLLFVSMPNVDSFIWKMLDRSGENPYWGEIEHLHNFGRTRLYALLREHGFEPCRYGVSERYVACMEVVARRVPCVDRAKCITAAEKK
jgi:SAM-dependent methyltransferase